MDDEIESLMAALENMRAERDHFEHAWELRGKEIERLRADLSARKCVVTGCGMYDAGELAMAYKRVKRLRTLLKMAREYLPDEVISIEHRRVDDHADNLADMIDAALRGEGE